MSAGPLRRPLPAVSGSRLLGRIFAALLGCLASAWLEWQLTPAEAPFPLYGALAGLSLAVLLQWGWAPLPLLWLSALGATLLNGQNPWLAGLDVSATLAGGALSSLLMRQRGLRLDLSHRSDLSLLLLGAIGGPLLSATLSTSGRQALGLLGIIPWETTLWCRWAAQTLAVMSLTPALLSLCNPPARTQSALRHLAQGTLAAASLAAGAWAFFGPYQPEHGLSPWLFLPALLLLWMGLRFDGLRLNAWTALALVLQAAAATRLGQGPFVFSSQPFNIGLLWGYGVSLAAIPLVTHALLAELRRERSRWQEALQAQGLGIAEWDLLRGRQTASARWQELGGREPHEHPAQWLEQVHPLDREPASRRLQQLLATPGDSTEPLQAISLSLRLPSADQRDWRWHELQLQVQERNERGLPQQLLATLADSHWQRTAEERQRMSVSLFQHLHEGLLVTDTQHQVLDANPSYCRMLGSTREALAGTIAAPLEAQTLRRSGIDPQILLSELREQGHWQGRVQCLRADGQPCTLQLTVSSIPEPSGPLRYHVVAVSDLTQQVQQQALLDRQARLDPLTGLPNQSEFRRRLDAARQLSDAQGFRLCVACLDLDLFKRFNALGGEALADRLLAQVAQRLQTALRSAPEWSDELARLGGDEFGLILRCRDTEEAALAAERMLNVLRAPFHLEGVFEPLELTGSLGATLYPIDHSDGETLMRHAAHALYRVKRSGRNSYQFFDTAKRLRSEARVLVLGRMQEALDASELQLYYQPKVDLREGRVIGVEALLRWQHPERGLLAPAHFLPEVESTGLGVRIGDWVIEQALRQCAHWLEAGLRLQLSVNVSARHLQSPDFAQRLRELLARHPADVAHHLVLEVLESTALADIDATQALIGQCRALGVRFALDDFGTGYSTLTYLKRLTIDTLKIDRSFVQNMLIDAQDRALVDGVVGLARHFGCSVVAEGVETAAHAQALMAMGCHLGQGSGISVPMPAADVAAWVQSFERNPVLASRAIAMPA